MVTKIMVSDCETGSVRSSGRWPCKNKVGSNSYHLCFHVNDGYIRGAVA